jgi:hypothetical protein
MSARVPHHQQGKVYASACSITAGTRSPGHSSMHANACRTLPDAFQPDGNTIGLGPGKFSTMRCVRSFRQCNIKA